MQYSGYQGLIHVGSKEEPTYMYNSYMYALSYT